MKKTLITLLFGLAAISASASEECPKDGSEIADKISAQKSCYAAAKIARDCAWGSGIDVSFVAAAQEICLKDFKKWPKHHKEIRKTLVNDCNKKYEKEEGSLARASNAHCHLNVDETLSSINEPAFL